MCTSRCAARTPGCGQEAGQAVGPQASRRTCPPMQQSREAPVVDRQRKTRPISDEYNPANEQLCTISKHSAGVGEAVQRHFVLGSKGSGGHSDFCWTQPWPKRWKDSQLSVGSSPGPMVLEHPALASERHVTGVEQRSRLTAAFGAEADLIRLITEARSSAHSQS